MTALLATQSLTGPSFDMGFDGAVDGRNYLFGESVYIIDFIKVRTAFEFVYVFPPCSGWQLLTAHRLVPLKPGFHIVASVVSVLSKNILTTDTTIWKPNTQPPNTTDTACCPR